MVNSGKDSELTGSSDILAKMANLFNLLGTDSRENINIILKQTCHILNGACSLYNRIDDKQTSLVVRASYNHRLDDIDDRFDATGHICWEATIKGENKPVILPDLEITPFFLSDSCVTKHKLKSYLGFPVKRKGIVIGSLCMVDTKKRHFISHEINCIQALATALSREEERLLLEQEFINNKERYRVLVENSNDAIYIIQDGLIQFANPKAIDLSGYTWNELKSIPFSSLIHPNDRKHVSDNYIQRLSGEKFESTYSFRIVDKQQKILWIQINAVQINWENTPAILGCIRNISELKALEDRLQRAEKMELIGTMAGGVAHDLNNILSGLVSYPELLLMQITPDSPLREPISFIHEAGLRAADIVQDLLTLTRRGHSIRTIINLNKIIHEYFNSPGHLRLKKNFPCITFNTDLESDLLNISGSPSHISKIVMNLIINAAEAITGKGIVNIKTCNSYLDTPLNGYDDILEGDYVVLSVSDNGEGISDKDLNRIFEPFYTKKQMGRSGSGLGLSVVWNSINDHNGYIEVKTKENQGTVFDVFFPATREVSENDATDFIFDDFKGVGQSILIIDDIDEQRKIAQDTLKMLGYMPYAVPSGEKGIEFLMHHSIDLILLDMKMEPGIDGLETYKQILKINPKQKAIIASGFSESDRVKQTLKLGAGQYIKKPYTIKKLAHALKKEMDK